MHYIYFFIYNCNKIKYHRIKIIWFYYTGIPLNEFCLREIHSEILFARLPKHAETRPRICIGRISPLIIIIISTLRHCASSIMPLHPGAMSRWHLHPDKESIHAFFFSLSLSLSRSFSRFSYLTSDGTLEILYSREHSRCLDSPCKSAAVYNALSSPHTF